MCLLIFTEENKKPITLTEDLVVYKRLKGNLVSAQQYFQYELNYLFKTEFTFNITFNRADYVVENYMEHHHQRVYDDYFSYRNKLSKNIFSVCEGFHSYSSLERLERAASFIDMILFVAVECIIPAGSVIYKDETGLIASNQIIINSLLF